MMPKLVQDFAERQLATRRTGNPTGPADTEETETQEAAPADAPADPPAEDAPADDGGADAPADDAPAGDDSAPQAADPAAVVRLCMDAEMPELAERLITEGVALGVAEARIALAQAIKGEVALARKINKDLDPSLASAFIAAGASLEHVRAQLFEKLGAMEGPETVNVRGTGVDTGSSSKPAGATLNHNEIYAKRKEARASWPINQ